MMRTNVIRSRFEALLPRRTTLFVVAGLTAGAIFLPRPGFAAWPLFGRALCIQDSIQGYSGITTDGAGGAIVVWMDFRSPRVNVFANHIKASGDLDSAWPANGRALLTDELALANAAAGQQSARIVSDGAGGAIAAWDDQRSNATDQDIYAQHVGANGVVDVLWPRNGAPLTLAPGDQSLMAIVSDGAGGAIVAWTHFLPLVSNDLDIYAQHIMANGVMDPRWPANGV